ncbi:hypothetical protein [Inquilinus sp.]|uniref:hypothetical protein n=1 Tax=Inquilinus sp. TaxID=1932117 RepID=UPI0031D3DC24
MPKIFKPGVVLWSAVALLVLAGCAKPKASDGTTPILSKPGEVTAEGRYVHGGSGMVFPTEGMAAGARFVRITITQFDDKGGDVSANYDVPTPSGRMRISAYVYPVPLAFRLLSPTAAADSTVRDLDSGLRDTVCQQEVGRRETELTTLHPEAKLVREDTVAAPSGEAKVPGTVAVYETSDFINNTPGRVRSDLYIFCYVRDLWIVKYRVTPVQDRTSEAILADFMKQVPWTPRRPQ